MLVLLGPTFEGSGDEYTRLARATGMLPYDLRTKLKPGVWGVVRALGDAAQAQELGQRLLDEGFQVAVIDSAICADPARRAVLVRAMRLEPEQVVFTVKDREMPIPYGALLVMVRGEIHTGGRPQARGARTSSAALRAVAPSAADVAAFRASGGGEFDAYAAADIHFITVTWAARIDVRHFDFSVLGDGTPATVRSLDQLADMVVERAGIRVDRGSRTSSVASFSSAGPPRSETPAPSSAHRPLGDAPVDERYDGYSRLIAEAERQTRKQRKQTAE